VRGLYLLGSKLFLGCFEHGTELSCAIKDDDFLQDPSDCLLPQ